MRRQELWFALRAWRVAFVVVGLSVVQAQPVLAQPVVLRENAALTAHHRMFVEPRSRVDRRIDRLTDHELQSLPPVDLIDPLRAQVTNRVTAIRRPLFFGWAFAQILLSFWLWRSGSAARIRDWLGRRLRSRTAVRVAYVAILSLCASLAALPFDLIGYRTVVDVGISHQSPLSWFQDYGLATGLQGLGLVVLIVAVLAIVDRSRLWYIWSSLYVVVLSGVLLIVNPLIVQPLFYPTTPLDPHQPLYRSLVDIELRAGVGQIPIFVTQISRTTEVGNAMAVGFGPTRRVLLGDTLLRTATPREIAFVMAHELGHQRHRDPIRLTLLSDLLGIVAAAFAVLLADRIRMRRDDDALSRLPLVAALFGLGALCVLPLGNLYSRHIEAMADSFGLQVSHDGVAGARMFLRFADEGFSPLCPPRVVRLYFYDHPPLGSRIAKLTHRPDVCP